MRETEQNPKDKNLYDSEAELLEEEIIYSHLLDLDHGYTLQRCRYCGYEIRRGQKRAQVCSTGDMIHEECWQDYAEDNYSELCCVFDDTDDGVPDGFFEED